MNYILAFGVGGAICALGQLLMDLTSLTSAHILVLFVCLGAVLSAIGWYQPLIDWAQAGATIPLTGFGHAMVQGVFEDVRSNGLLGIFSGVFKNTTSGIAVAIVLAIVAALAFDPKG